MLALAAATSGACLSVDPIDFESPETSPFDGSIDTALAETDDAAALDGDGDGALGCYQCIEAPDDPGPGCGTEYAACAAQPKCDAILKCVFATGCFYLASTKDFINCAIPCAADAGVTSTDDPIVLLGLNVAYCADRVCRPYCGGGETGS
jgi:hypothetical protein